VIISRSGPLRAAATLLATSALAAGCAAGSSLGQAVSPGPRVVPRSRPNIVFVLTDDLTRNLVPYMPHVLAMERAGMTFTNYTVTDSLCCPSRASIFTGMYPHDTHVWTNSGRRGGFEAFYRNAEQNNTFATAVSSVGYRTAMMGKFLNQYAPQAHMSESSPYVPPGWSEWDVAGGGGYREFGYALNENHVLRQYGSAPGDYLTTVLDGRAQQFIRSSTAAGKPFLLEVATFAPHRPYVPAPADAHSFLHLKAPRTPAWNRLPTNAPLWLAKRKPLSRAEIASINDAFQKRVEDVQSVDRMIGDLEQTIAATGQSNNTIFVFSSDNGYHMGEYRLNPGKLTAFDTDIRVPLVVMGPGIPAGVRNPAVVQNVDLAPTFDALAGAPIPPNTDGRSIVALLHGQHPKNWPTLALIEHHGPDLNPADPDYPQRGSGNPPTYAAIRSPTFLYVRYHHGEREYYNLVRDPYELHNLAPRLTHRELQRLDAALAAFHACSGLASCQRAGYRPGLRVFTALRRSPGGGAAAHQSRRRLPRRSHAVRATTRPARGATATAAASRRRSGTGSSPSPGSRRRKRLRRPAGF
jgi:N-acetylglucosamine-6-sulfatase